MVSMDDTRYYLGFNLVYGIGPARLDRLINAFGSISDAWHAPAAELMHAGLEPKLIESLLAARRSLDLDAEHQRIQAAGIRILTRVDADYPAALLQTPAPPPLIYLHGTWTAADAWAVAMVGTRSPTNYGREAARRLAFDLASAGVTIVSGLALGIDAAAHSAALEAGGRTIGVLAGGVDQLYPERNRQLGRRMIEQGALVSDQPVGTRPLPQLFPARNRLISGLARGLIVVEAGLESGALITVEFALEQGREVFAVPGSIFSRVSQGTHRLLRDGANLATCAQDVLDMLHLTQASSQREARTELPDDPVEAAVLEQLSHEPQHIDTLGRALPMPTAQLSATLAILELKGLVRQSGAMEFVRLR